MEHSEEFLQLAEAAKSKIREISVKETLERMKTGTNLIDVREDAGKQKESNCRMAQTAA